MKKSPLFCALSLAITLLAPPIGAQGPAAKASAAEADALTDKARQLYEEGLKALSASRWAEAHASFLAAWRIKPHYQIASNLGVAELKLGKHRDAAEHLTWYLREAPATKVEERRRAEALLKEARAKVTAVTVQATPEGAEVTVDGAAVGVAPLGQPVFVEPGEHAFAGRMEGYQTARSAVEGVAGGEQSVELRLEKVVMAVPAPSESGSGTAAAKPTVPSVPAKEGGPNMTLVTAGAVTAGVAAAAGVVFAVMATGSAGDADEKAAELEALGGSKACAAGQRAAPCDDLLGLREDASTFTNVAAWSFIGAGLVGAGTLIYWLTTPGQDARSGVRASPVVGVNGGGIVVRGAW